jgi:putative endonuclease
MMDALKRGQQAEQTACTFLISKGLRLIERNYRTKTGEIDLIMRDGNDVVFIEVRARHYSDFGSAIESVNWLKQQKLIKAATHYLIERQWFDKVNCRFDIIGVTHDNCEWIPNAFTIEE